MQLEKNLTISSIGLANLQESNMRDYGVVHTKFWTEDDVQNLSDGAQLLFLYLLTGPHTTAAGCFRLPLAYISADRRWSQENSLERFAELSENGFAYRCENTEWVIVPKFLKHNPIPNPNCGLAVAKALDCLPKNFSKLSLLIEMLTPFDNRLPNGFLNGLRNRLPNGMPNHEQDQEQEQDLRNTPSDEGVSSSEPSASADMSPTEKPEIGGSDSQGQLEHPAQPEPTAADGAPKRTQDRTPHQAIIALYHEILPMCPKVEVWRDRQRARLRTRWNEDPQRQSLDWWRDFFQRVAESDWLTGRVRDFVCDLDWLVGPENMAKVLNGRYVNRGPRTGSHQTDRNVRAAQAFIQGD